MRFSVKQTNDAVLNEANPGFLQRSCVTDFSGVRDTGGVEVIDQFGGVPFGDRDQEPTRSLWIQRDLNESLADRFVDDHLVGQVVLIALAAAGDVAFLSQARGTAQQR